MKFPHTTSILTQQALRSLRVWQLAKTQFAADRAAGLGPMHAGDDGTAETFGALPVVAREAYLAEAEATVVAPPAFLDRDASIGVDQVSQLERARGRVLAFAREAAL